MRVHIERRMLIKAPKMYWYTFHRRQLKALRGMIVLNLKTHDLPNDHLLTFVAGNAPNLRPMMTPLIEVARMASTACATLIQATGGSDRTCARICPWRELNVSGLGVAAPALAELGAGVGAGLTPALADPPELSVQTLDEGLQAQHHHGEDREVHLSLCPHGKVVA